MNDGPKRFVLRKYVTASTAADALKADRKTPVSEIYLDDRQDIKPVTDAIGFRYVYPETE